MTDKIEQGIERIKNAIDKYEAVALSAEELVLFLDQATKLLKVDITHDLFIDIDDIDEEIILETKEYE